MKSTRFHLRRRRSGNSVKGTFRPAVDRAGSILIAVLWLMALLWVLGIFFFLFASGEQSSARYYSDAAKTDRDLVDIKFDLLADWTLEQLIVGANPETQGDSPLNGGKNNIGLGRHSMLAHILGDDLQPYNGRGIHLISDPSDPGIPKVDQDYDGVADVDQTYLDFNYSGAANVADPLNPISGDGVSPNVTALNLPAPNVGYTYPDINVPFLAYNAPVGPGPNGLLGDGDDTPQILISSFHRPQYLRAAGAAIQATAASPNIGWDRDNTTYQKIFRPHVSHVELDGSDNPYPRYLTTAYQGADGQPGKAGFDDDGDMVVDNNTETGWPDTDDVMPFPFVTLGLDGQPGEAGVDDDGDTVVDNDTEFGWPGTDDVRFREGVWTGDTVYKYDADPDGDGIKEAVWMDLDFPIQEAGGRKFKPIFAITVYDAGGLINLNAAGNTSGTRLTNSMDPTLPDPRSLLSPIRFHQSNQALTPSEISLQYALDGVPDGSVVAGGARWEPYNKVFSVATPTANREVMANMDTFSLLYGRGEYSAGLTLDGELLGRYGDRDQLVNALTTLNPADFPKPGQPLIDDDEDQDVVASNDPVNAFAFNQPLEISGAGTFVDQTVANYGTKPLRPDLGVGPNRWVQYLDYDVTTTNVGYDNSFPNLLSWSLPPDPTFFQVDEADEMVLESGFPAFSGNDAAYGVDEMAFLHKSDSDPDANLVTSRLRDLMINFNESAGAAARRKQFTTISWDRVEMGLREALLRPWEMDNSTHPDNGSGVAVPDFPPLVSTISSTDTTQPFRQPVIDLFAIFQKTINPNDAIDPTGLQRRLDLNRHLYRDVSDGKLKFRELTPHPTDPGRMVIQTAIPPFPPTTVQQQEYWARRDRQEKARDIYVLLYVLCGGLDQTGPDGAPGTVAIDDDGLNGVDDPGEIGWVGSDDITYYSSNVGNVLYTPVQLKQMAQFAVNLVDALDADNVITKFEFDMDLSNGWNLDDNPYGDGDDPTYAAERNEVFGVEAQQLTFSEALVFKDHHVESGGAPQDHDATLDDDRYDRIFTYLELRNASPLPVETGTIFTNSANELGRHWRIKIETTDPVTSVPDITNILTLSAGQIPGGGLFTIGNNGSSPLMPFPDPNRVMPDIVDPTKPARTELWVDPIFNGVLGTRERIIPRAGTGNLNLDLSLNPEDATAAVPYRLNAGDVMDAAIIPNVWDNITPANSGSWFDLDGRLEVTFVLERRTNLTREAPRVAKNTTLTVTTEQENDNPWVEVDRIKVLRRDFQLGPAASTSNPTDVQTQLAILRSFERNQPLAFLGIDPDSERRYSNLHTAGNFSNSIGNDNESTLALPNSAFRSWQPHFNRHFASTMELLSVPLYGSKDVTSHVLLNDLDLVPTLLTSEMGIIQPPPIDRVRRRIAQEKFLFPDFDNNPATPPVQNDNRWYRLFEFVEVPSRMHEALGELEPINLPDPDSSLSFSFTVAELDNNSGGVDVDRVPGKLNLNTLRHPGVLGGMIDAPLVHDINLIDLQDANRHWWNQFIAARDAVLLPDGTAANLGDGRDPVTGQFVPGVAGTRPFRDFSHVDHGGLSVEHTLLRSLPTDGFGAVTPAPRGLFEVGTKAQHDGADPTTATDYYTRHRLLSKVMNHATTRSHVYMVFIEVKFFEVIDDTPADGIDNPKIGAALTDSTGADAPGHRGFFIVDMSKLDQAYTAPTGAGSQGQFDFRKFIQYRRTIE